MNNNILLAREAEVLKAPRPFPEPSGKFWQDELFDDIIPEGFLSDFVLHTRGVETPTQLSLWTALWLLSGLLKRESIFQWHPEMALYPNLFIFLVGPPKIVAKSTAIGFAERILFGYTDNYATEILKLVKKPNLLRSKATPEALGVALKPQEFRFMTTDGEVLTIPRGSQLLLAISELSTFLGKQKYNEGLIDFLTHLYDCKDEDDEATVGRGHNKFFNVYVNLIGATTKQHLEDSIPEAAFGGGFMSRVNIIYQPNSTRDYPFPMEVPGAPDLDAMRYRAAWVAWNSIGTYTMTSEAKDYYSTWYMEFKKNLAAKPDDPKNKMEHRRDLHLLKIAMLVRAAEYREGREIDLVHITTANKILNTSMSVAAKSVEGVGISPYAKTMQDLELYIKQRGKVTRRQLLTTFSYKVDSDTLTKIIDQLLQQRSITGYLNRQEIVKASRRGNEVYMPNDTRVHNGQ